MLQTGTADLPLHMGHAPRWLFKRMVCLSGAIAEAVIVEYGSSEFLRRIADPTWFQALACVIGFDWHSSGTTTTACGALKIALSKGKTGVGVAGGKGKTSKKAPSEIGELAQTFGLPPDDLIWASRMSAKVDTSLVQDGYDLYHHSFFISEDGEWAVIQQGMDHNKGFARRYHWLSSELNSFVEEPHQGICSDGRGEVLDMTASSSRETREVSLDFVKDGPERILRLLYGQSSLFDFTEGLALPARHEVLDVDIGPRGMNALRRAYELQPESYEELVSLRGMGPKTVRALALVSDIVHGAAPCRHDPATYSFAHGGKDGYPYPVDRRVYDESIAVLRDAVDSAKLGRREKTEALRRLAQLTMHDF